MNIEEIKAKLTANQEARNNLQRELDKPDADIDACEKRSKELLEEKTNLEKQLKVALEAEKRAKVAAGLGSPVITFEEEPKVERKYTIADKEYRSAWAKKLMGFSDDKLTEEEKRALGDAVTTTATTFVASSANAQGVNNGGLFIPTDVRMDIMELIEQNSPFFSDIRKLQVNGNIDLPYLFEADNAEWYAETSDTKNEGQEYRQLQLTGWELAKDVVITWKLEEMAVESFIDFIVEEIAHKMGIALVTACVYGDGSSKPTGVSTGLTAITDGDTPIDTILNTYSSLDKEARIGAKAYVSTAVMLAIISYKDQNGNYPFLQGIAATKLFSIEVDPYLDDYDIIVGNPRFYILNENTPIRIDRESQIKGRKVVYGGYGVFDGKGKPGAFAYGQYTPAEDDGE